MSEQPSFDEFKRQRELERLKRRARGEESGEQVPPPPRPRVIRTTRRRHGTRELELRSTFGL